MFQHLFEVHTYKTVWLLIGSLATLAATIIQRIT
jgi:hypothetical protein